MNKLACFPFALFCALCAFGEDPGCGSKVVMFELQQMSHPPVISLPNSRKLTISLSSGDWFLPDIKLQVAGINGHQTFRVRKLLSGGEDAHVMGYRLICWPHFSGAVLALGAGADGAGKSFLLVRSNKDDADIVSLGNADLGSVRVNEERKTISVFAASPDDDNPNLVAQCTFCAKRYRITEFSLDAPVLTQESKHVTRVRLSPRWFVDHPIF